jgi:hypothetical protein
MVAVLFSGFKGEVWLEPGAQPSQGALYRAKREGGDGGQRGGVCLVLGAGGWRGWMGWWPARCVPGTRWRCAAGAALLALPGA